MGFKQKIFLMRKIGLDMENRSDDNLFIFYLNEIKMIDNGILARLLMPLNVRKRLINIGILKMVKDRGFQQSIVLTEFVKKIINEKITKLLLISYYYIYEIDNERARSRAGNTPHKS